MKSLAKHVPERPPLMVSPTGYWRDECGPQTKTQKADRFVQYALENLDDVGSRAPDRVWQEASDRIATARKALNVISELLKELDPQYCDRCSRWKDDDTHKAYCESSQADDEYDARREALITGNVYGGAPAPGEGA